MTTTWNVVAEVLEQRTLLSAASLDWGVSFGTSAGTSIVNSTAVDSTGDVYIAGVVTHGTVDVDPGAGTANVTAENQTGFVAKYDPDGHFVWVETFASDRSMTSFSLTVDASGGVYVAGGFRGTATFGFGESNPATLVNQGGSAANGFIAKLDQTTGDVAWVDGILGNLSLTTNNVAVDSSGRVFIAGQAGSGTITITSGKTGAVLKSFDSTASNYVARFDATGGVTWAEGFAEGKATIVAGSGLAVDGAGNVYLTGALLGKDVDFDPGTGRFTLSRTARKANTFVAKLDVDGNFEWATKDEAAGFWGTSGASIAVDNGGNTYLTMQSTAGGRWGCRWGDGSDDGHGMYGGVEQQLAKIDSSGNWEWTRTLTPTHPDDRDCDGPSSVGGRDDEWSHGDGHSVPCWTPPVSQHVARHATPSAEWRSAPSIAHHVSRRQSVSRSTAKVSLDGSGNAIVVSATYGAAAYSSTGSVVWSTLTPMPVTDVAVDSSGNIVFVGMFNGELNIDPDGTYLLDSNTWRRKSAPFLVRWNVG